MEQIIKFGIPNYLQLCVEAGFSQIQSHIIYDNNITNGAFMIKLIHKRPTKEL